MERSKSFVLIHTGNLLGIRDYYCQNITHEIQNRGTEEGLPFASKAMYESWISYAPYFFDDFYSTYENAQTSGVPKADIVRCLGRNTRIIRYFTQLLLPGAYLDDKHSETDKIKFIGRFCEDVSWAMYDHQYPNPESVCLVEPEKINHRRKTAIIQLISLFEEACESIYLGDQNIGYPNYGLDKSFFPDHNIYYQDFDLNLGCRNYPDIGLVQTCTIYPKHWETYLPYVTVVSPSTGNIFQTGYWSEGKWKNGRPYRFQLVDGYVIHRGKSLSTEEVFDLSATIPRIIEAQTKIRQNQSESSQKIEYCFAQSLPIRALNRLIGQDWQLSPSATRAVMNSNGVEILKTRWNLNSAVSTSRRLIGEAINWVNRS